MHRGPQAASPSYGPALHAPNAALLIDFDNVTMGIRSDLGNELRNLLSSDIIKGKVAVQRAYADWRRYPNYVVTLAESSIDMIMAPAYGPSKKNATDIRLAVDAMELVFTRPEIGTYILLSGDSDFASLVTKLKEYGKYVIGVGIRESSSDLLVMNCDEYYSYNALAGLVKTSEEEQVRWDPWELVVEALQRMKRNGDVMRSDRLKQVMQEIDSSFDEKDLGMSKFSRFVQEAAQRGLLKLTRLENGQIEVDLPDAAAAPRAEAPARTPRAEEREVREEREERAEPRAPRGDGRERGRGRDRGRGREREHGREPGARAEEQPARPPREREVPREAQREVPPEAAPAAAPSGIPAEMTGERLTRDEAFDLVRRAVADLTGGDAERSARASEVRRKARELLGRDSESLSERFFLRILRDAHDADVIDLRKRGDDYEVGIAAAAAPITAQLEQAETTAPAAGAPAAEPGQASRSAATAAGLRRGMRGRVGGRGRPGELPPELLSIGVVETVPAAAASPVAQAPAPEAPTVRSTAADASEPNIVPSTEGEERAPARGRGRGRGRGRATKSAAKSASQPQAAAPAASSAPP
ncbi:MAG TPA: NYN domain-containing protein, partial [Gemmatimonadaceae bacterium]|nr:NYN domain-containing protein [Gemmatimonadaceae bacterium]